MKRAAVTFATCAMALCLLPAVASAAGAPTIEYSTPSPIRNESAVLRFSVNPEGLETSYEINVARVGASFTWIGPRGLPLVGEEPVAKEFDAPHYPEPETFSPGTEYHWRVKAWNEDGETVGAEQFFTTTEGPTPVFDTVTAVQTASDQVRLNGTVDPEGAALTGCRFRWVTKSVATVAGFEKWAATEMHRFGETVPCNESVEEIGSGSEPVPVEGVATGLEPGEYAFRVEGENAFERPEAGVVGQRVLFTVSADFGAPESPLSTSTSPALTSSPEAQSGGPSLESPAASVGTTKHVSCSPAKHGKAKAKKRKDAKKSKRAKAKAKKKHQAAKRAKRAAACRRQ